MDSSPNPLLLQLKQLFIYYLYGIAVNIQPASLLAHFPAFPEEDLPGLEMLLNDKMRTFLLTCSSCLDSYLQQEGLPAALAKLHSWHLRCQFVNTSLRDQPHFEQDLEVIREILFEVKPSLPQVRGKLAEYERQMEREIEMLEKQGEEMEALRVDTNEQIYYLIKDLFQ